MFGFTVWLVIGGIVGWIASVITRIKNQQTILGNIIVGVVGAYVGGALIAPMVQSTPPLTHVIALLGAVAAVGACDLVKRARLR